MQALYLACMPEKIVKQHMLAKEGQTRVHWLWVVTLNFQAWQGYVRLTAPGGAGATPGESARLPPSEGSSACAPDVGLSDGGDCAVAVPPDPVAERPDAAPELPAGAAEFPAGAVLSRGFCPTAVAAVPPEKAVEGGVPDSALYGVEPVRAGPAAALSDAALTGELGLWSTPAATKQPIQQHNGMHCPALPRCRLGTFKRSR